MIFKNVFKTHLCVDGIFSYIDSPSTKPCLEKGCLIFGGSVSVVWQQAEL